MRGSSIQPAGNSLFIAYWGMRVLLSFVPEEVAPPLGKHARTSTHDLWLRRTVVTSVGVVTTL